MRPHVGRVECRMLPSTARNRLVAEFTIYSRTVYGVDGEMLPYIAPLSHDNCTKLRIIELWKETVLNALDNSLAADVVTTFQLGYCTGGAYIYIYRQDKSVKFSASLRSRLERLRRVELISKFCAVPSLELDSISMGDLTETLMFAVYRSLHFSN